jgi:hypothetical protein
METRNIAFANRFASTSVGNAFVFLDEGARDEVGRHSLGASTETYQQLVMTAYLAMTATIECLKSNNICEAGPA